MRKEPFDKKEEPTRDEENLGNKSFAGATTTDREKQRLETVKANALGRDEPTAGSHQTEDKKSLDEEIDQGAVRSAAFTPEENDGRRQDKDRNQDPSSPANKG